jgi:hygromycin-B 4-O-kinase
MYNILDFLKKNFNNQITELAPIEGGERSKAFYFMSKGNKYVFRKNRNDVGFLKDKYAFENFGGIVPIPKIIKIGVFEDSYYAISEFCEGVSLSNKGLFISDKLIKKLFQTLDNIHSIKKTNYSFGLANIKGVAKYKSWNDWVLKEHTLVTKKNGEFYTWNDIKNINFVDKTIIDKLIKKIKELLPFVPNICHLIHGDFATGNVLVSENQVTGVIDWNEFGYGDFLYDIAWLDFWTPNIDIADAYKAYLKDNKKIVLNYKERVQCHKLFICLTALGLYAAMGKKDIYKNILKKLDDFKKLDVI